MKNKFAVLFSLLLVLTGLSSANEITLLHERDSAGSMKAISSMVKSWEKQNISLKEIYIGDADLSSIGSVRKLAVPYQNKSALVAISMSTLQRWYDLKLIQPLTDAKDTNDWMIQLPHFVRRYITYRDEIIAAPISIHVTNWVYANKKLIDDTGFKLPQKWDEFLWQLRALRVKGVDPILHDGSRQQDALIFESVFLATSGVSIYKQGFDDLNAALRVVEPELIQTFSRLKELKPYINRMPEGTKLAELARSLRNSEAGFIIHGDWMQGELTLTGQIANQNYYCMPVPGEHHPVAYTVDIAAAIKTENNTLTSLQDLFLQKQMEKDAQFMFNNYNGGLPALINVGLEDINECVAAAAERINFADANQELVPSLTLGAVTSPEVREAVINIAHTFMTEELSPEEAATQFRKQLKRAAMY